MYFVIISTSTARPTVLNFRTYGAARNFYEIAALESNADSVVLLVDLVDGEVEAVRGVAD